MKGAAGPEARAAEGPRPLPALGTRAAASAASGLGAKPPSCSGAPALGSRGPALPAGLFHRSDPSHLSFGPKPAEPLGHHRGVTGAGRRASASGGASLPPPASPAPGPLHSLPGAAQSAQLGLSVTPPRFPEAPGPRLAGKHTLLSAPTVPQQGLAAGRRGFLPAEGASCAAAPLRIPTAPTATGGT